MKAYLASSSKGKNEVVLVDGGFSLTIPCHNFEASQSLLAGLKAWGKNINLYEGEASHAKKN